MEDQASNMRGRSRGRGRGGEEFGGVRQPGAPVPGQPEAGDNVGVGRGRSRGRAIRLDSPGPAGRALLWDPQPGQPGQDSVGSLASSLASSHITEVKSGSAVVQSVGRGATRLSKEQRGLIVRTKPDTVDDKKGTSGKQVDIVSNYFKMFGKTNWILMQYRVDFKPEEDSTMMRKSYVRDLKPQLGKFMFDGTVLFTAARLTPNKKTPLVLSTTRNSDNTPVEVTFKKVGEVQPTEHHYLQFFNTGI